MDPEHFSEMTAEALGQYETTHTRRDLLSTIRDCLARAGKAWFGKNSDGNRRQGAAYKEADQSSCDHNHQSEKTAREVKLACDALEAHVTSSVADGAGKRKRNKREGEPDLEEEVTRLSRLVKDMCTRHKETRLQVKALLRANKLFRRFDEFLHHLRFQPIDMSPEEVFKLFNDVWGDWHELQPLLIRGSEKAKECGRCTKAKSDKDRVDTFAELEAIGLDEADVDSDPEGQSSADSAMKIISKQEPAVATSGRSASENDVTQVETLESRDQLKKREKFPAADQQTCKERPVGSDKLIIVNIKSLAVAPTKIKEETESQKSTYSVSDPEEQVTSQAEAETQKLVSKSPPRLLLENAPPLEPEVVITEKNSTARPKRRNRRRAHTSRKS